MPAPRLRPVGPRMSAVPPVMYSRPWSPTPSTTAVAPELRTQKRSPTRPRRNISPRRRAVADDVAGDDVLLGHQRRARGGPHDDPAAGQALADVVVGVALEAQRDAGRQERAEALAGGAGEREVDGAVVEALRVGLGDLVAEHRADGAVDVADGEPGGHRGAVVDRVAGRGDELVVEVLLELVVLGDGVVRARAVGAVHLGQDRAEVEAGGLPVVDRLGGVERSGSGRSPPRCCGSRARRGARAPPRR